MSHLKNLEIVTTRRSKSRPLSVPTGTAEQNLWRTHALVSLVEVIQFKYSIASANDPIRGADIAKTLKKFAAAETDFREKHSNFLVKNVIRYNFATNRPIHHNLADAITALRTGEETTGDVAHQVAQTTQPRPIASVADGNSSNWRLYSAAKFPK